MDICFYVYHYAPVAVDAAATDADDDDDDDDDVDDVAVSPRGRIIIVDFFNV